MANRFLDAVEYANVFLMLLKNNLVMGRLVDGQHRDEVTDENGLKINIKRPPRFLDKKNGLDASLQLQDVLTGRVDVEVTEYSKVHIGVGDIEYVQSFNELMRNQTIMSAASRMAHSMDSFLQDKTLEFASWVGTPGTVINTPEQFFEGYTRLMENGTPDDGQIAAAITYQDGGNIRGDLQGNNIQGVNRVALETSRLPPMSGIQPHQTQQTPTLVTGNRTDGAIMGANQEVNYRDDAVADTFRQSLTIDGLGANATISRGEVFEVAGMRAYDWRAQQVIDRLMQFTVVADAVANGSGEATVTIEPAMIVWGTDDGTSTDANKVFATTDAVPADDAVITWKGSASTAYKQRSSFHKRAISMVSARLFEPFTGTFSYAQDEETGISIRYWRGSDITTGQHIHRWDGIYGATMMDSFLGTRQNGS